MKFRTAMTNEARMTSGIILLTVPTIIYGGYFLLTVISGQQPHLELTEFQRAMFRAGHAHAGVLVILSLVIQTLVDHAAWTKRWRWLARLSFPLAAITISLGFFAGAMGEKINEPTGMIVILYVGMAILTLGLLTVGIGLIKERNTNP